MAYSGVRKWHILVKRTVYAALFNVLDTGFFPNLEKGAGSAFEKRRNVIDLHELVTGLAWPLRCRPKTGIAVSILLQFFHRAWSAWKDTLWHGGFRWNH